MTNSADQFINGFAQAWRQQQKRLWTASAAPEDTLRNASLEQAWRDSCRQWWNNLHPVVPQPLLGPLAAALEQSQLCLSMALRGHQITTADLTLMMQPLANMQTALLSSQNHEAISPAQRTHLHATQALITRISTITQQALAASLQELHQSGERPPRELFMRCAEVMESVYREHAARDDFVQLIGQWVNSHVEVLNARGEFNQPISFAEQNNTSTQQQPEPEPELEPFSGPSVQTPAQAPDATNRNPARQDAHAADLLRDFSDKLAAGALSMAALPAAAADSFSAHEVVFECDGIKLRHFRPATAEHTRKSESSPVQPPLLLVYSLVNRPYILDLNEDRSLVRALCATGRDVYLLDWGNPGSQDSNLGLDDYTNRYLHRCVTFVQNRSATETIDLVGICQGGTLALCYAAMEPTRVRKLALLAAPIDFHANDFLLARWLRDVDVDALVNTLGNVPGHLLNWAFIALRPVSLSAIKALELLDLLDRPHELAAYTQMERWLQDGTDQAGRAFADFALTFVLGNALVNANARIGDRSVDLGNVTHKVLNVYATHDHIVPASSSRPLAELLPNAECSNRQVDCGHIAVFAGHRARTAVPRLINEWLNQSD
ncbi:MAG: polyhydroxyalkanoate synthase [Gammaproteobacteria bacterium]